MLQTASREQLAPNLYNLLKVDSLLNLRLRIVEAAL